MLISSCSVPTFGLPLSSTNSSFLNFTSLNPFGKFFRPLQPHSNNHNWGICMIILFQLRHFRNKPCQRNQTPLNFHKELSRITLYRLLSYILIFNYCYRYKINLAPIVRSQFIDSAQKRKNWPDIGHLTSILSECFWPPLFQTN